MSFASHLRAGSLALVCLALFVGCWLSPGRAFAANILFVSDSNTDNNIPAALIADGNTVTVVINDYVAATDTNPTLVASLAAYDAVYWSATGATGTGELHAAATFTALSAYVSAGGHVFITGYDSIASPADTNLIAFLGGTAAVDLPGVAGPVVATANVLNTGVVDIRGVTPSGGSTDLDALTGSGADVTVVVTSTAAPTQAQWLIRTMGAGLIAYVSQGAAGPTSAIASWTNTAAGGVGAYNAALRNFAEASCVHVLFVSDANTDNNIPAALEADPFVCVTTVINDYVAGTQANPTLEGALGRYDAVVWSASGNTGAGAVHRAATIANLTAYVNAGGYVYVTGADALADPADPELITFVGGTGAVDRFGAGSAPSALTAATTPLTVGRVDIRSVTPTGGGTDYDALTGFGAGVTVVAVTATTLTEAQWVVRTVGSGRVAFVSNGDNSFLATTAHPSWTNTAAGGAGAYNASVRNFIFAAEAAAGPTPIAAGGVCSVSALCRAGACADGVCCNSACGGSLATDCQACSAAAGAAVDGVCGAVAAATTCRASVGGCDAAEACNGVLLTCPADAFAAAGTSCRASAGVCDAAETCTGTSVACPADAFVAAGTGCRPSAGICDAAEACTGAAAACPANAFVAAGTGCRPSAGICDAAEACTGAAATCPADVFAAAGTGCRPSAGICDAAEACSGTAAACPGDGFVAAGTGCRPSADLCDEAEACTGAGAACPADGFVAAGTSCRASVDVCDVGETCTGVAAACPGDGFAAAGSGCRASADVCDVAEACTGAVAACPTDGFAAAGTSCRAAAGVCDVEEACSGGEVACPTDGFAADGTACDDTATCNGNELCAAGTCAPGTVIDCDDSDACTADSCAEPAGCAHDPVADCCNVDIDCDDGDACTDDLCDVGNVCAFEPIVGCGDVDGGMTDADGGATDTDGGATDAGPLDGAVGDSSVATDAGRPVISRDDGGCGCTVPDADGSSSGGAGLVGLGVLAVVVARRRRR